MSRRINYRLLFLLLLIAVSATVEILREHRPSFLRPELRLYAYVGNNPLTRFDPDGRWVCNGNRDQCAAIQTGLNLAQAAQKRLANSDSAEDRKKRGPYKRCWTSTARCRKAGDKGDNGVNVSFASLGKNEAGNAVIGQPRRHPLSVRGEEAAPDP